MTEMQNTSGAVLDAERKRHEQRKERRAYVQPRVLSAERLEAVAATCAPPTQGRGKSVPIPCGTLGS